MDIGIEETRKKAIGQLDYFKMVICFSINSLFIEENDQNDPEVIGAWQTIIRKKLGCLKELLEQHKENVAWSMLDEQQEKFKEAINDFFDTLTEYREFEDEPQRKIITQTIKLLKEGVNGFRQGFINDTYYEDLLHEERERYRQENYDRLEHIYQQDFADEAYDYPDETERKNHMVTKYRNEFLDTRFGKEYRKHERNEKQISAYIVDQKEQNYVDINNFFCTWLALDIAQEHCHEKHEQVYKNFIFKDNVDIDKVMGKLTEYVKDKTLKSQKHWYVVYRVFEKKKWLKYKLTQKAFRDQMNAAFERVLKSTEEDFRKVGKYFKVKEYADWTLDDGKAPSCCKEYRGIADTLDQEFQDKKYAKPGTLINTRKIEKLR